MELLLGLADVIDENAEELARLESQNVGKPWWVAKDEPGAMSRLPPLLRGGSAEPRGQVGRRVRRGLHLDHPARAARDRRGHLPLELPAVHGDLEDLPGARGRQRPDHQARRADAAHAAPLLRARAGDHPAGRAPGRHRRRHSRPATRSCGTRTSASSRSRATRRPARSSRRTPPTPSSASTWSSAARRRWSCSTTPIRRRSPRP